MHTGTTKRRFRPYQPKNIRKKIRTNERKTEEENLNFKCNTEIAGKKFRILLHIL